MAHIPPLRLVLSGGGVRGLSYVGCFLELEKHNMLKKINEILAVSCGTLFGLAFMIGYTPNEIKQFAEAFDFTLLQNIDPEIALNFFENYGIDNGENLERLFMSMLKNKNFSINLTFEEHYKATGLYLRIFAANIYTCELCEFSYKITPHTKLTDAAVASCSIPGYFIPKVIDSIAYADGGIINNYPISIIPYDELKYTLGFTFSEDHTNIKQISSILQFFNQIYACFYLPHKKELLQLYNYRTIIIPCGDYPLWNFGIDLEDKTYLIECGRKAVSDYLNFSMYSSKPKRRYSVS